MELEKIIFNPVGRLRCGWRLIVFVLVFIALMFLVGTFLRVIYAVYLLVLPGLQPGLYLQEIILRLSFLFSAVAAGILCTRRLEGLPAKALGLTLHHRWMRDLLIGSALGVASFALAALIAAVAGGLGFTFSGREMLVQAGQTLLISAVLFLIAGLAEEALFRGYPLQTFTRAQIAWVGVLLTSLPFAAVHLRNPNVVQGFTFINTALAGVWLAVAYLRTRSLWFPLGVHWAWNWAQGSVFGIPVSGLTHIAPQPLFRGTDYGPAWLTGGDYGIEGGIACTIALIVSTVYIWKTELVSATPELLELTSRENPRTPDQILSVTRDTDAGEVR
ncbi:MAG TPA: type II CAAX endopeptidase family protein [Pyrinomonadaceae bacterium]|nr:type II CAAX endopeptidase family protein [Pyrinomonadaceae bacterium]